MSAEKVSSLEELEKALVNEETLNTIMHSQGDANYEVANKVYDAWRVSRDQMNKGADLISNAIKRLKPVLEMHYVDVDEKCFCGRDQNIGAEDLVDAINSFVKLINDQTNELDKLRLSAKRGSKRGVGGPQVRERADGVKEVRTLIKYETIGGIQVPRFFVEETVIPIAERRYPHNSLPVSSEIRTAPPAPVVEELPEIQRPSAEVEDVKINVEN